MALDEAKLIEKLSLIEALFAGATTQGEKDAADRARQRIRERLKSRERTDPPVEHKFSMGNMWSRKVFVALLRRYGIKPQFIENIIVKRDSVAGAGACDILHEISME